ncbi:hypothetical protein [Geomonas sp.]|uniref:hypothetical protein n=1 Tax=Geomonas sp. TaxID=2651584 RepID=UPI002B45BF46|nr:hypothetical protein [Geomonas sp.]HJV34147.1 hypothetical protein [Geomonas sp.]
MRFLPSATILFALLPLGACSLLYHKEPAATTAVPKELAVPVTKNWQVKEQPPVLTNERNEQTLPFQKPQSVQPPGAAPVLQPEERKIETPLK